MREDKSIHDWEYTTNCHQEKKKQVDNEIKGNNQDPSEK